MIKIKGNFKRIIYKSNNFNIVVFKMFSNQDEDIKLLELEDNSKYINVILKDTDIDLTLDYQIDIRIEKRTNSKYKINYFVENKTIIFANQRDSIIKFLSSSLFKGISSKSATKLVDEISDLEFVNNIEKYEEKIKDILGNKKAQIIIEGLNKNNEFNGISKTFIENNLSIALLNIFNINIKNKLKYFLENNIFDIILIDNSIDFLELDKIAKVFLKNYSIDLSNQNLILHQIIKIEQEGSTINEIEMIYSKVVSYRNINIEEFKKYIKDLYEINKIIIHENKKSISSKYIYDKEKFICDFLKNLNNKNNEYQLNKNKLLFGFCDPIQKQTIINCLSRSISIITGGPGTGKTFLIKQIMKNLELLKVKKIELLAPTGKAAIQISKNTNRHAKTFHSFLKWNEKVFEVNKKNPSNVEVIIIDEFSMINIELFYSLLIATPKLKHLILIGDSDQLPAIGSGDLLNDFINSNKFYVSKLEKIYRQSEGSLIATNSKLIRDNKMPIFDNGESILIEYVNEINFENEIINIISKILKQINDLNDFQILIPMYNSYNGIENVNKIVQNFIFNNEKILFTLSNRIYYRNDKVIQLENDNNKNVFNGEIGKIIDVEFNNNDVEKVIIEFDNNKIVEYSPSEFNKDIKLAYAISIHKFQGSECKNVLLILMKNHYIMFSKKLFYTAYTRAREKIKIISSLEIIKENILSNKDSNRIDNINKLLN